MRRALALAAIGLIIPAAASGHVTIAPPFVEQGIETTISFATPNERPPHATTSLAVTAPAGIAVVSATAPTGWSSAVAGSTVTWSGGSLENRSTASFSMTVRAEAPAGTYAFQAIQTYDDGETVDWKADLGVLPASGAAAPKEHPWGAVATALAGIVVIAGSLVGLRFLRRRSLQER